MKVDEPFTEAEANDFVNFIFYRLLGQRAIIYALQLFRDYIQPSGIFGIGIAKRAENTSYKEETLVLRITDMWNIVVILL